MPDHTVAYCASRMEWAQTEEEYIYWLNQLNDARERNA